MYVDKKRLRKHPHKMTLDDYEQSLMEQMVAKTGEAPAVIARRAFIQWSKAMLHEAESADFRVQVRLPQERLMAA